MPDNTNVPIRRYNFKKVLNLRDIGGYCSGDGRITRYLTFLRSDDLSNILPSELNLLKDKGLSTVIDLRTAKEAAERVHPCLSAPGIDYYNISLLADVSGDLSQVENVTLGDTYVSMLENKEGFRKVFKVLAAAKGTALFHCAAGKDRTGVVAALLLLLAGVAPVDIVTDYQISFQNIKAFFDDKAMAEMQNIMNFIRSDPENMELFIKALNEKYYGAEEYLLSAGVSPEELKRIREKFLV